MLQVEDKQAKTDNKSKQYHYETKTNDCKKPAFQCKVSHTGQYSDHCRTVTLKDL